MTEDVNVLTVRPDGPNVVTGEIEIVTRTGLRRMQTAVLCRCGLSADKPFCDGAHVKSGFRDPARLPAEIANGSACAGRLVITPLARGPNRCDGPITIRDIDGRTAAFESVVLCRCGASARKPYCDGSHERIGFIG